jgi:hypothetical protein
VIDDLAGLARVALATDNLIQANAYTDEILAWLNEHGTEGIEYPLQVQLTCYEILCTRANDSPQALEQAQQLLTEIHQALLERADNINDLDLRHKFLRNVKSNCKITQYWQNESPS